MKFNIKDIAGLLNCFGSKKPADDDASPKQPESSPAEPKPANELQQKHLQQYKEFYENSRKDLTIVHTTKHADGRVIDWIPIKSQAGGNIASPPPLPEPPKEWKEQPTKRPKAELEVDGAPKGPAGTVPIPRQNMAVLDLSRSLDAHLAKPPPVDPSHPGPITATNMEAAAQPHWYASSAQAVANHGGAATYSLFKPYTQSNADFSLLQTAVIRFNVPKPGNNSTTVQQTVEAGWINYPAQVAAPHLFSYYTTNGYSAQGNNIGGWNRDQGGWVQVDSSIFPGSAFAPLSTNGGAQYELPIRYQLYQGNWWLLVLDKWIGYYPGTLFGANTNAGASLQDHADQINFYGEIYQSESATTTTDMGSGEFANKGFGKSAYIRGIVYTDTSQHDQLYDGSGQLIISDQGRYTMDPHFKSGSTWGSYAYLGGPGAGGKTGG